MPKMIFVNLPVEDLTRSVAFYEAVGGTRNAQFSDDSGACMVFSDAIFVMLLTRAKFASFAPHPIADARATTQMLLAISADSRTEVDRVTEAALAAGGTEAGPTQDHGFMYGRSFADPDGHIWEPYWMNRTPVDAAMAPAEPIAA